MKKNRIIIYLFLVHFLLLTSTLLHAQCGFVVDVIQEKESDCQSNGIVKATLKGANVTNGNIQLFDAQYSIASTSGGYSASFSTNGGVLQNIPPGTYTVTARAYCNVTKMWVTAQSGKVTITGLYSVPDLNKIYVVTANIKKSLKCAPTGQVPIKVEGGKPPYSISIMNAPSGYTGTTTFTNIPAGLYVIENLSAGNYEFRLRDDCTYSLPLSATVGEIEPVFSSNVRQHARTCIKEGVVTFDVSNGLTPYTINITQAPAGYIVPQSHTQPVDGTYSIDSLPVGNYTFEVKDDCGYTKTFTHTINEIRPNAASKNIHQTIECDASGSFDIDIQNGVPPYSITVTSAPATYPIPPTFTQNQSGIFTLDNLPQGTYNIDIVDSCGYQLNVTATINIDLLKINGVSTSRSESCKETGSLAFTINGGKAPYSVDVVSAPATYNQPTSFSPISKGQFKIDNVPAGNYSFNITDACGEILSVSVQVDTLKLMLDVSITGQSFNCLASGSMEIDINGGTPPYFVIITNAPLEYGNTPDTIIMNNSGKLPIGDLPQGDYTIVVVDSCQMRDTVDITKSKIGIYANDIPNDPFYTYFYPPTSTDATCTNVQIRRNDENNPVGNYWNPNSANYYEVLLLFNGTDTITTWQPVTEFISCTLPKTYRQVRNNNDYVVAKVQLKDNNLLCNIYVLDTVWLNRIVTPVSAPHSPSCNGFNFSFNQNTDDKGVLCYPYSWELRDSTGTVVKQGANITTSGTQTVSNVLPYGKLTLHLKDNDGYEWIADTITYYWRNNSVAQISYHNFGCDTYTLQFNNPNICYPYTWELRNADNSIFASLNNITNSNKQQVNGLIYDTSYQLYFIDNNNDTSQYTVLQNRTHLLNYKATSGASKCMPEVGKGFIKIYRDGTDNNTFTKGTRLRYISGATVPTHADITLDNTQDNLTALYPFSTDTIVTSQNIAIKQGIYQFEIIDTCGVIHPIEINYEAYTIDSVSFTKKETCAGVMLYPKGEIYLGTTPQPVYFRIRSYPSGIAVNQTAVPAGGMLFLPESGEYVIQMSADDGTTSCPVDSIVIPYIKRSVALDRDATKAYICDEDSPGYIYVQAVGGVGPYSYILVDNDVDIEENNNGEFSYGVAGASYNIRIYDKGCDVSFEQGINMLDLSKERLVYGTEDVCVGATIQLNCVPISSSYHWTGPDGFTSSLPNPSINKATFNQSGTYSVTIQPKGCLKIINQDIDVTVHQPDMPSGEGLNIQCLNAPSEQLKADFATNHHLQWYGKDGKTPLPDAPTPNTSKVDTITYYVAQISDNMNCESPKKAITSIISDLPDSLSHAIAPDICPGVVPLFLIPNAYNNYTYNLYTRATGGEHTGTAIGTGDTLKIYGNTTLNASTTYYVEVLNNHHCRAIARTAVPINVVDYLYIKPDKIPSFQREVSYNVQLQTNAAAPYEFTALESLPFGFQLSASGEITGTAPRNGRIDPTPFTVKVIDNDGCVAIKQYELTSDIFTPQAFTPNGDGYNDHFMKGKRLLIFDRLGVKIFEGEDGWDGTRNGQPAPADTYFYIIYYINDNGGNSQKTGYITLLRRR